LNGLLPPLLLSATALGFGVVLAVSVGVASGLLPGIGAMRMRVVDALRGSDMAIPVIYNLRSVKARWSSAIVAVVGIAGTVGVFVAMLSLARGFKATLVSSGSEDNAIIMRAGATSEMTGGVTIDTVKIIQDEPGIARSADGPLVTPEVVLVARSLSFRREPMQT